MSKPDYFADVPISIPVVIPQKENYRMNGFAWSDEYGIIVGLNAEADLSIDYLRRLRKPKTNKNTMEQQ